MKRSLILIVAILASFVVALAMPGLASADTKSCTLYGGGNVQGQYIPSASYCMTRVGSGRSVSGVQGEFYGVKICNYDVTAEFFDSRWGWKRTLTSGHNYGCAHGTTWMPYIHVNKSMAALTGTPTGYLCSTLRAGGQRVTSSCQYIY